VRVNTAGNRRPAPIAALAPHAAARSAQRAAPQRVARVAWRGAGTPEFLPSGKELWSNQFSARIVAGCSAPQASRPAVPPVTKPQAGQRTRS
jgi:hypothetical protein